MTDDDVMVTIPVIDFNAYNICVPCDRVQDEKVVKLSKQLADTFSTVGFVYLKNHGISEEEIENLRDKSKSFFDEPEEVKFPYKRPADGSSNNGWVPVEAEKLNPKRNFADLKEAYNYSPGPDFDQDIVEVKGFTKTMSNFYEKCTDLAYRVLDLMAIGLEMKDKDYFRKCHHIGSNENTTTLRCLYYPPLPENSDEDKPDQVRCGEHSDYGSITLLYQDQVGGLEVQTCNGNYIPATPIEGTVLVNLGDMMQRWSADKFLATKHRVLIPKEDDKKKTFRQSFAFFVQPDNNYRVCPINGSNKYQPITSTEYLKMKFTQTY